MESSAKDRLQLLSNQLRGSLNPENPPKSYLDLLKARSTVNSNVIRDCFFGRYAALRDRIFKLLVSDPNLRHWTQFDSIRREQRYNTTMAIKKIARELNLNLDEYKKDPAFPAILGETLCVFDANVAVKTGVHLVLYTGAIASMGTARHSHFLKAALNFEDMGCFALSELEHGSNVRGIETTATYDPASREFIINTPKETAMKFWIGGAAQTATMSIVWAQLITAGKCHGVHAFIVPLRNKRDFTVFPGITIGDCGPKVGLNGIDNGFITFNNVRIPRINLLNRFSGVSESGEFSSPIKNDDKRFGMCLFTLSSGRLTISAGTLALLRMALTISTRFAANRKQFGPPDSKEETAIIDYPLTQARLLPHLAALFAYATTLNPILDLWTSSREQLYDKKSTLLPEIHALFCVMKAQNSWYVHKALVELRPLCGGLGYSTFSRFGSMIGDSDVNQTYEGDNYVIVQQTLKFLLDKHRQLTAGTRPESITLEYLRTEEQLFGARAPEGFSMASLKSILEFKSNILIVLAARELAKALSNYEGNVYEAWQAIQPHFGRETAVAYYHVFVANKFASLIEGISDRSTKIVMTKLFELWALSAIREDFSALVEVEYLPKTFPSASLTRFNELCAELKNEAVGLINAIADPEELIGSPLATTTGDMYQKFLGLVRSFPGAFERPPWWQELRQ
eukprot:TRINITY_DN7972_c0_g1_i4.p1 TRINITY_DN7972_c0_g1~~TRINITY_DN7972_c0_g1_i4.p1  ORF type:complete len:683 (+),score=120.83 TRINITY_DN7972_c0_g1_i4:109-2157(+)